VIVAEEVTAQEYDRRQLAPLVEQIEQHLGRQPEQISADSGYFSSQHLATPVLAGVDLYVPPEPERRRPLGAAARRWDRRPEVTDAMRQKLATEEGRRRYRRRQTIVEPVFGTIKQGRAFRQFLLRGLALVRGEWTLACAAHNLLKLYAAWWAPRSAEVQA